MTKAWLGAALGALVFAATPAIADAASVVNILLQDPSTGNGVTKMQVVAKPDTVPAGRVTFHVSNQSKDLVHEMLLLKVPASGKLPYNDKPQRVIESKTVKLVDTDDIKPGESVTKTVTLAPGKYVAICNEPAHYASGMHTPFTVTR